MMEYFVTGYCKQLDASRMVEIVIEEGHLAEADCCYPDCPLAAGCTIAQSIAEKLK